MKFKGEHQDVTLRGIELAGSDRAVAAGGMNELVGLVERDGKWEPYGLTKVAERLLPSGRKQIYIHKTSYGDNVLCLLNNGTIKWVSKSDFLDPSVESLNWQDTGLTGVDEFTLVGNMITDQNINSVVFVNGGYENYDTTISDLELPNVQLRVSCNHDFVAKKAGESGVGSRVVALGELQPSQPHNLAAADTLDKKEWISSISGLATRAISECAKKGGLHGYTMAVIAYRLMNGEYILASMPILLGEPFVNYKEWYKVKEINGVISHDGTSMQYSSLVPKDLYSTLENGVRLNIVSRSKNDLNIISDENYFLYSSYDSQNTDLTNSYYRSPSLDGLVNYYFKKEASQTDIHEYTGIVACKGNALEYKISADIDNRYKKTIDSVCIFLSKTVNGYDISASSLAPTDVLSFEYYHPQAGYETSTKAVCYHFQKKSSDDILKELKEIDAFYKVKEIPFEEIKGGDWIYVDLEGKLGDSLYTLPTLPPSAFSNSQITDGKLFAYNSRIHVFDYQSSLSYLTDFRRHFFNGGYGQWDNIANSTTGYWRVIARCHNESIGDYTLDSGVVSGSAISLYYLNGILCYPNQDCYEMEIRIQASNIPGSPVYGKTFAMSKWKELGLAVYWAPTKEETQVVISGDTYNVTVDVLPKPINWTEWDTISDADAMVVEDTTGLRMPHSNIMRVSDVAFPFFPNAQTYTIGKSKIIGMAHLSVPLSQDAYAKTALIVFCDDGIYTLGVDATGKLAYDTITPFMPEVCTARRSICSLGGGVVFVSRRGLMVCTANGVEAFTPKAMGELRHLPQSNTTLGTGLKMYRNALNEPLLTHDSSGAVDGTSFEDYIQDANMETSYLSTKNAILLYIKSYQHPYCYMIDVTSRCVTKIPKLIVMDDNNYPEQLFYTESYNGGIYTGALWSAGLHSGEDFTQCIFQTRPLYMGGIIRRSFRFLLRGDFKGPNVVGGNPNKAGLYVLGSLDGVHWKLMGGKEKDLSMAGFHDLGCETYRDEVAYLMVIFTGYLHKDSHIDKMEVDGMYN